MLVCINAHTLTRICTPSSRTWNVPEIYIIFTYKICQRNTHVTQRGMWSRVQRDRGSFRAVAGPLHPQVRTSEHFPAVPTPVPGPSCIGGSIVASRSQTPLCLTRKVTEVKDGYCRISVCGRWAWGDSKMGGGLSSTPSNFSSARESP